MSSNSSKGKGCHSAKCRRAFLHESIKNGNSKDVKSYFKLMGRLGAKDERFTKYLQSDLKYFVQRGGDECLYKSTKETCTYPCIWDNDECINEIYKLQKEYLKLLTNGTISEEQYNKMIRELNYVQKYREKIDQEKIEEQRIKAEENFKRLSNNAQQYQQHQQNLLAAMSRRQNNHNNAALEAELAALEAGNT